MNVKINITDEQIAQIMKAHETNAFKEQMIAAIEKGVASANEKITANEIEMKSVSEIIRSDESTQGMVKSANHKMANLRYCAERYRGEVRAYNKMIDYIKEM